jgi:hypothetical protein
MSLTLMRRLLKFWLFPFLSVFCSANPIFLNIGDGIDESHLQMTGEEVHLSVGRESTSITGTYHFAWKDKDDSKGPFLLIRLPVYVGRPIAITDFDAINALYSPAIFLGENRFSAQGVENGRPAWRSFWRGAKFFHAEFIFRIPASLVTKQFSLRASYQQPHMTARGKKYACYCPFIPNLDGDAQESSGSQYDQFKLRAIAAEGSSLKRVSKNSLVFSESAQALEVRCYDNEEIILLVIPAAMTASSPSR